MRCILLLSLLTLLAGCRPSSKADPRFERLFVEWLKGHGETKVVTDAEGVGLEGNATRLAASIYDSQKQAGGGYVVETEFRITLPNGAQIVEFVAGLGDTEDKAIDDCVTNFILTSFHVVYKSFLNADDPHQTVKELTIGGKPRKVAMGDIYLRSEDGVDVDLNAIRPAIEQALADLALSDQPHWIKIVYGQHQKAPTTVAATLDNEDAVKLTETIKGLGWPKQDGFYMAKQFIVIQ
jgi:uncharacterized protein DUF6348